MAILLFICTGELIAHGGVGKRPIDFARSLLAFMPGGPGVVTVSACTMFGSVSGSAVADRGRRRNVAPGLEIAATGGQLQWLAKSPDRVPDIVWGARPHFSRMSGASVLASTDKCRDGVRNRFAEGGY